MRNIFLFVCCIMFTSIHAQRLYPKQENSSSIVLSKQSYRNFLPANMLAYRSEVSYDHDDAKAIAATVIGPLAMGGGGAWLYVSVKDYRNDHTLSGGRKVLMSGSGGLIFGPALIATGVTSLIEGITNLIESKDGRVSIIPFADPSKGTYALGMNFKF